MIMVPALVSSMKPMTEEEIEEVFEMVDDGPDNDIIKRAKEFIVRYKRDKKINNIIDEKD